jgi:periplasmic protein TonB
MPHALLLSPDDQAVSAITAVLEEMSVTCERPLDGPSAAQKLNAHSFDLVLVDCENLPAAKLIFDACRRGNSGNNPVPIAIVDGRAGLPTAFRLGAELILTKPVAKDQARNTVRNAVSRMRKDVSTSESVPAQPAPADVASTAVTDASVSEEHAQAAAAAAATSSQLTNFAEPVPSFVPSTVAATASTVSATALTTTTTKMRSAIDQIGAAPADSFVTSRSSGSSSAPDDLASSEFKPPLKPSDDPVLAELESKELEEAQQAKAKQNAPQPVKAAPTQPAAKAAKAAVSSYPQGRKQTRLLAALLMLVLCAGGFYAAWTYQPGFRVMVQPSMNQVLALVGIAPPPTPAVTPAKSLPPVTTPATRIPATAGSAPAPVQPPAASSAVAAPPLSATTKTPVPVAAKSEAKLEASQPGAIAATPAVAPPSGESNLIILSSKGAEQRLAQSVPPQYPVEARAAEGTIVLKEVVDEHGKVEDVRLVEGNPTLATAAIKAVKQWRYRPYIRDGKAQPFQTVVIIDFQRDSH